MSSKVTYLLVLLLMAVSCAKKPLSSSPKPDPTNVTLKESYALVVSFYSTGYGTNREAKNKFIEHMDTYKKKHSKPLNVLEAPWGREGEVDYCIDLDNLSSKEKADFITGVQTLLANQELIHLNMEAPCSNKRR